MKYGELITRTKVVLVVFVSEKTDDKYEDILSLINDNSGAVIQYAENVKLFDAIRITVFPTFIVYIDGQMVTKQSGEGAREAVKEFMEGYANG